jgi:endonuclease/exonuclease/phosphatase family metal-dependent hydrolase
VPAVACRVVTWNLWWRFGDWERRLDAIGALLGEVRPDVVGLQEVWARGDANAAGVLARRLGLHWAYVPSPAPQRWQRRIEDTSVACGGLGEPPGRAGTRAGFPEILIGNAVLSRWPVVGVAHADLPAPASGSPDGRRVLHALLSTPAGPLPFFTTQLSAFPGRSGLRCAQVRRIAQFVASHAPDDGLPPVVTGDLNAVPEADEVRLLEGFLTEPAVPDLLLVDAWRYAAPDDRGITWGRGNPHAAVTGEPDSRIDYVLVGTPRAAGAALVTGARVVGDRPWDGVWPSDHAAVVADLRLGEPAYVGPGVA